MIRVLVAGDSAAIRQQVVDALQHELGIVVVGEASDEASTVESTRRLRPTLVIIDLRAPNSASGATRRIMADAPTPIVVVSGDDVSQHSAVAEALGLGALCAVCRPIEGVPNSRVEFLRCVKLMARVRVVGRRSRAEHAVMRISPRRRDRSRRVVAVAASTGGPGALVQLFESLGADYPLPVLVVQHLAVGFVRAFSRWLDSVVPLGVGVAADGEALAPSTAYLAPDDRHLCLDDRGRIRISASGPVDGFRPSATELFSSAAQTFGRDTIAVVLTGMGNDGVRGLRSVRDAGGLILAQDRRSSVVFGMPGAAAATGLADEVLPLTALGPRLRHLTTGSGGDDDANSHRRR